MKITKETFKWLKKIKTVKKIYEYMVKYGLSYGDLSPLHVETKQKKLINKIFR